MNFSMEAKNDSLSRTTLLEMRVADRSGKHLIKRRSSDPEKYAERPGKHAIKRRNAEPEAEV